MERDKAGVAADKVQARREEVLDQVMRLQDIVIERATGSTFAVGAKANRELDLEYRRVRGQVMKHADARAKLPDFVSRFSDLQGFWDWIQPEKSTYAERRDLIRAGFRMLITYLESVGDFPDDAAISETLEKIDSESVRDAEREYDVALSFAGEDREYVERVAEVLDELEVSVFYDRFEEVNLWGKDLWEHLHAVYSKESRFVVVFVSRHSAKKAWPGHERRSALSRQVKGESGRILPVRLDDTSAPGIPSTMTYMDARVLAPEKLANLIREKVDVP